jgi:hypothetical protein
VNCGRFPSSWSDVRVAFDVIPAPTHTNSVRLCSASISSCFTRGGVREEDEEEEDDEEEDDIDVEETEEKEEEALVETVEAMAVDPMQ